MTTGRTPSESTLRRRATQHGKKLSKIREGSKWYQQYGQYILTENNIVTDYGMDLEAVAAQLA